MWVEFDHFSKLLGCCFPGYWCCSGVKQDKQTIKSEEKLGTKHNPQKDQWTAERERKKKDSSSPICGSLLCNRPPVRFESDQKS